MSRSGRRRVLLGAAVLAGLAAFVAARIEVTTDIVHFLPRGAARDDVTLARGITGSELTRTMILLVGAADREVAVRAGRAFEEALRREPRVAASLAFLEGGPPEGIEETLWRLYHPRRLSFVAADAAGVAAATDRAALDEAAAHLKRQLALPISALVSRLAPSDPLLVLRGLFERLAGARAEGIGLVDGRFVTLDGGRAVLFLGTDAPSFDARAQRPLLAGIRAAFAEVDRGFGGGLTLASTGANRFAVRAEESIRSDVRRVSSLSIAGAVALFLLLFRSLRPAALTVLVVASGFVAATAATLLAFGRVHGVTLAFGAALIGVSMDYTVHFVCHHALAPHPDGPRRTLAAIWPGLLLGAATTVLGFLALVVSTFPGLRELAIFAAVGISAALMATRWFLPALVAEVAPATRLGGALATTLDRFRRSVSRRPGFAAAGAAVPLVCGFAGLPAATWNDDISDLNRLDPALVAEDAEVRGEVVRYEQRRMVVAVGTDEDAALAVNDRAAAALEAAVAAGELGGFRGVAGLLPSPARQREVDAAVRGDDGLADRVEAALAREGFRPEAFAPFRATLESEPPPPLGFADLLGSPLAPLVRPFRLSLEDGRVAVATFLADVVDPDAVAARLATIDGAAWIDVRATLAAAYGAYRDRMTTLLLLGLLAIVATVVVRYRDGRRIALAVGPALLGAFGTVGLLGLLDVPLNLLSLVALLMVVSMGVDHGVFLAEARDPAHVRATGLAIVVAGASTVLGFGLLALSDHPALFSIGATAGVGVVLCLVLAPTLAAALAPPPEEST